MIEIRKVTIKDEVGVFDLLRQLMSSVPPSESAINSPSSTDTFREIVKNDEKGTVFVAEEDDRMIGLITLSYPTAIRCGGKYSCIEEFIVSEQARGKGVGGKLLEASIAEATARGCYEVQVNRPSEIGYPVYLQHGWEDLGKHLDLRLPRKAQ